MGVRIVRDESIGDQTVVFPSSGDSSLDLFEQVSSVVSWQAPVALLAFAAITVLLLVWVCRE